MGRKINHVKVQLSHRTDDRFTATIKLIGWSDKDIHLIAFALRAQHRHRAIPDMGATLDRKLADFYLDR